MRIAITDASGDIGSATLRGLGTEGGDQIVGIARRGRDQARRSRRRVGQRRPDEGHLERPAGTRLQRRECGGVHLTWACNHLIEELGGVSTSRHSAHQTAADGLLGVHARAGEGTLISRTRPTIVGQRSAASALLRCGFSPVIPAAVVRVHGRYGQPPVHRKNRDMVENVADALARKLQRRWAASSTWRLSRWVSGNGPEAAR